MAISEQKIAKIRAALLNLEAANDKHWTDDGLPREGVVRQFAGDQSLSRNDINAAQPGFQRYPAKPGVVADAATQDSEVDPLTGDAAEPGSGTGVINDDLGPDPTKNQGELMTEEEVRLVMEQRVKDAISALTDAQAGVRAANAAVIAAQEFVRKTKDDLNREFPPLSAAENVKQYIASEMAQRAAARGFGPGIAPGSQIDMVMQRSNSRGWRRPVRNGPVQTSGVSA